MYNRYIPNGMAYTRVVEEDAPSFVRSQGPVPAPPPPPRHEPEAPRHEREQRQPPPHRPPNGPHRPPQGGEKKEGLLTGLLKSFHLDDLDTGDILLLLILVFLVLDGDGDNLELIVTLGLVILFSLGDKKGEQGVVG